AAGALVQRRGARLCATVHAARQGQPRGGTDEAGRAVRRRGRDARGALHRARAAAVVVPERRCQGRHCRQPGETKTPIPRKIGSGPKLCGSALHGLTGMTMTTTAVEQKKLLINNEWRDASGGKTMEVVNPATEEVCATVASATKDDVETAVQAARAALNGPWGKMSARERGRLVSRLADRLMERADEVSRLETLHNGKPIFESRQIEIPAAAECFEYYAGWADKVMGETIPVKGNYL